MKLLKKMDLLLEWQKILEDKVTRLENELHINHSMITEHDFVEVYNFLCFFRVLRNTYNFF